MKKKNGDIFWMSFSDLMTSLFFVVLVLYVLTYVMLKKQQGEMIAKNDELKQKLKVYDLEE